MPTKTARTPTKTASTPTKTVSTPNINLRCFVAMQFLSQIYALSWRTIYRPKTAVAYKRLQIWGMSALALLKGNEDLSQGDEYLSFLHCHCHHFGPRHNHPHQRHLRIVQWFPSSGVWLGLLCPHLRQRTSLATTNFTSIYNIIASHFILCAKYIILEV